MLITSRRCEILKKNLEKNKIKTLNVGSIVLNVSDLEFSELPKSSNTKINCKKVKDLSLDLIKFKEQMNKKIKEQFKADMNTFLESFGPVLYLWSKKVSFIDFINSLH